jgi:hypothetical protein
MNYRDYQLNNTHLPTNPDEVFYTTDMTFAKFPDQLVILHQISTEWNRLRSGEWSYVRIPSNNPQYNEILNSLNSRF